MNVETTFCVSWANFFGPSTIEMLEKVKLTSGHITNEFNNAFLVSIFKSLDTGFTP